MLYNIPGRTGVSLTATTIERLSRLPEILCVKEATGSLDQTSEIVSLCSPDFIVLSGDDSLTLPLMSVGAQGVVSVVGNIVPKKLKTIVDSALAGDFKAALEGHKALFPLCKALLSLETNPIPIKAAMAKLGRINNVLRLPMTPLSEDCHPKLAEALTKAGIE
eukprot:GFYU01015511.1.p1 GENE.GFYU01015511.1~~GFYU01015511.1.p1  ORF type:complete len:184 (-),score=65.31 GFYU01015511.1:288-776(-)